MLSCARRSAARAGAYRMLAAALFAALVLAPATLLAFGANPPLGYTGAPGQGTCASCHGTLTAGSGVTVNAPSTYAPGGPAISMTVTIPATGGFELAILTQSGNAQAGALAAGPPPAGAAFPQDAVSTVGTLQYLYSTVETTTWTFGWTPPATSVGNVVLYVTGGQHNTNYSNSYVIAAPVVDTIGVMPNALMFNVNGAVPPTQTFHVFSTSAPLTFTAVASVATPVGGNWLSALPRTATTPLDVTVAVDPTGLAAGTYTGTVAINASAPNSPQNVGVTLNVTTPVTGGQPPPLCFNFDVIDDEAGGSNHLLLGGHGTVDEGGNVKGSGRFRIYNTNGSGHHTLEVGRWKATSVISFTPAGPSDTQDPRGGVLVIQAEWTPMGGPPFMATMTIADTGTQSGVTVTIIGGASYSPSGVQEVELVQAGQDASCRAECGREGEDDRDRNRKRDDDEDGGHSRERR